MHALLSSDLIVRTLIAATVTGTVVLGVGGRLAMAVIQASAGASPRFTLGGTMTVVGLGAVSGLAGGLLSLLSRAATRRLFPGRDWPQHVLFAVLLLLVTIRGLRGTPSAGHWYFYLLVAVYGVSLSLLLSRGSLLGRKMPMLRYTHTE